MQPCAYSKHPPRGFSLIELLVVVAMVSILASIGLPLAELAHRRVQEEELRQSLRQIRSALDAYKKATDAGQIVRQVNASGYPPSLDALVTGVVDAQSPRGSKLFFLRRLPRDPFAPAEITDAAQAWGLRSYESTAEEPIPGKDVFDIYSKSEGAGMNGVPYRKW